MTNRKDDVITNAKPHTIKKFELIQKYISGWAQKLLNIENCEVLVYIDCMCNSGIYKDNSGQVIEGSAIRVAKILADAAKKYTEKRIELYFNDLNEARVDELKRHLPENTGNFQIITTCQDSSAFLREIGSQLYYREKLHYFLLYDPYDARIDWEVLLPFYRNWGEVLINHMISDPIRAIRNAKKELTKEKYELTYLTAFEDLLPHGDTRPDYEKRVIDIIEKMKGNNPCYVASFPFFNKNNALLYDMVHYTSNIVGFNLFKTTAWKVFGGKSSAKCGRGRDLQMMSFNFDGNGSPENSLVPTQEEDCFTISNIAEFLWNRFKGKRHVLLDDVWSALEHHPIFPANGFCPQIKKELIECYHVKKEHITVTGRIEKKEALNFV